MKQLFAAALVSALIAGPALAQQQPEPSPALAAEWAALQLQQNHTETAINRLIASYEARLATAMQWLRQAQQDNDTH
ncbi:MAG TPA: hypothetical protein VF007_04795, partial [Stellaceae bacterium]